MIEIIAEMFGFITIIIFALYALSGARHGFLCSCANTGSVAVSWLIASNITPVMSSGLYGSGFHTFISYMTEATDNVSNIDLAKTAVASLTADQTSQLADYAKLPGIFNDLFMQNVEAQAFASRGLTTVENYLNETIACVTMNIFCFVLIYAVTRLLFMLVISTLNFASPFAVLKHLDPAAGAVMGGIRAFMVMFVFSMLVPVALVMVSGTDLASIITDSPVISFFYDNNMLFGFIGGTIG